MVVIFKDMTQAVNWMLDHWFSVHDICFFSLYLYFNNMETIKHIKYIMGFRELMYAMPI